MSSRSRLEAWAPVRCPAAHGRQLANHICTYPSHRVFGGSLCRNRSSLRCCAEPGSVDVGSADSTSHGGERTLQTEEGWGFPSSSSPTKSRGRGVIRSGRVARAERSVRAYPSPEAVSANSDNEGQVSSYCWANGYHVSALSRHLSQARGLVVEDFKGVLHVREPTEFAADVFVFPFGAVVIWGLDNPLHEAVVLETLKPFERGKLLREEEYDGFRYLEGNPSFRVQDDVIFMIQDRNADPRARIMERLAVSYALAQSVKLITFEEAIQDILEETQHFPEELAKTGAISDSRRDVARKLGRLLQTRHEVYLHADMTSTPEFFWEYASLEPPFLSMGRYLESKTRADMLNKRVEVVRELFDLLSHELQFKHSSDLEVIIIILISVEIGISLFKDAFLVIAARSGVRGTLAFGSPATLLGVAIVAGLVLMLYRWLRRARRQV
uniref:DUF155 domain-containing protein n=1 Tax=Compsopogon caeruleus TaxID=31354 RepID=A0A6T6C5D5_9RHOD|mmetsp:Transcript_2741/g.4984  ORF Transcript_2741/g.4984 Transcript_2741/m.4984 type:complete len:440 (+) Transcript_2741:770-2089(+)